MVPKFPWSEVALLSALLARDGFTASEQAIEGRRVTSRCSARASATERMLDSLGAPWKILETGVAVSVSSCACTIPSSTARSSSSARTRSRPRGSGGHGGVNAAVPRILIHSNPRSGLEAKFSGEFSAAAALCEGRVGIATFRDDKTDDPAIRALMKRVRLVVDPAIPGDLERHMWTRVTVRPTTGGKWPSRRDPCRDIPGLPPLDGSAAGEVHGLRAPRLRRNRADSVRQMVEQLERLSRPPQPHRDPQLRGGRPAPACFRSGKPQLSSSTGTALPPTRMVAISSPCMASLMWMKLWRPSGSPAR